MNPIKLLDFVTLPMIPVFKFPLMLGIYLVWSVLLYLLAKRTRYKDSAILAFVPLVNFGLLFRIGRFNPWLALSLFVPGLNLFMLGWTYHRILRDASKPGWWALLMFINPIHLVILGILANTYGEESKPEASGFTMQQEVDPFTQKVTIMD